MNLKEILLDLDKLLFGNKYAAETHKSDTSWEYSQLREYLLSISRNPENLISINDYPKRIRLSKRWHEILDKMRHESKDELERWSFIGGSNNTIVLQENFLIGEKDRVPGKLALESIKRARDSTGTRYIGDVHSHPVKILERRRFFGLLKENTLNIAGLSITDLHSLVLPYPHPKYYSHLLGAVVEGNGTIFAFRTKETKPTEVDPVIVTQEAFNSYWRLNYRLSESDLLIAERHKLVFYRGFSGEDLVRTN